MRPGSAPPADEIVVIGAGLQGCCIALELAHRGVRSHLIEQDPVLFNRASLRNEGKIHLGLIYAADPTFETASIQLQGALTFWPLLRRWVGDQVEAIGISTPFAYLVAPDSLMSPDALGEHYARLEHACRERLGADTRLDYMGQRPDRLAWRMSTPEASRWFAPGASQAVFATSELAIDTFDLAQVIRAAVENSPMIRVTRSCKVEEIRRVGEGVDVSGLGPDGRWSLRAAQVINCTWEERFRLDAMMGLQPPPGWVHRLKYRTIVALPAALRQAPSATMVLGAYGDVVVRPSGTAYLSWYPTGMRGWTHDELPPAEWAGACRGEPDEQAAADVADQARRRIDAWYPGIAASERLEVDAGVIVAYGKTDVDDPDSRLHDRTRIGVNGGGDYMSVDPGKLTTAPMFATEAVDRAIGSSGGARWR